MSTSLKNFGIKFSTNIPVDEFIEKALYDPKFGYYTNKNPFGKSGDFITAPNISNLFSEIILIWLVSSWETFGKPKNFNFVELGPGDGSLTKVISNTCKRFPEFDNAINIYLYEKSNFLKKIQKKKIKNNKIKWIKDFNSIKKGPVIFFGNEFFDAIPIKQFLKKGDSFLEKCFNFKTNGLNESYQKALKKDVDQIVSYKTLNGLQFIEYPKLGLMELNKVVKKISSLKGGILLVDYGYLNMINKNTLQSVMNNKKIDMKSLYKFCGNADITSLVNFSLLREYFNKKNLKTKKVVSQKFFLEKMGIMERVKILEKNMTVKQKNYFSITLNRLLNKDSMGELFKVIFAYKSKNEDFLGFD